MRFILIILVIFCLSATMADASPRKEVIAGPVEGRVIKVLDGDTVTVVLHVWIGQQIKTHVRIAGIDTPEMKGKCMAERSRAADAKSEVEQLVGDKPIRLYNIQLEKYAGP